MEYYCLMQSAISYIESRVRSEIDCGNLSRSFGVSEAHFRDLFASQMGVPPGRYALSRRVANAAFELSHTDRSVVDIALDFGFDCPDTFTRAFKRETGMTPSAFRSSRVVVGRVRLVAGAYGPGLKTTGTILLIPPVPEEGMNKERIEKSEDACVLYGVKKVHYCPEECTPFPAALRSCLNYLGQDVRYPYLMAATGAAFRLRWNASSWDPGNIDIMNVFADPEEAFVRGFRAAGRSFTFLRRDAYTTKEDFTAFIRAQIDQGRPVLALGIIGPPEACIITGYRKNGNTLLGWNFFQEMSEFGGGSLDESGYFVTDSWWENPSTRMLMAIGTECGELPPVKDILTDALNVLERESITNPDGCVHLGGQGAYRALVSALSDDTNFPIGMPLPQLFERLMCVDDALMMLGEARASGALWLKEVAAAFEKSAKGEAAALARKAAQCLEGERKIAEEIEALPEWREAGEKRALALADPSVRKKLVSGIVKAASLNQGASEAIRKLLDTLR
ncbi:MAG: helix-turn-helix domain-containing protein [Spirochaetales bacterium]|nr:helix-turn-helix domain-containing protein [Spirochaetales bacterium]